MAFDNLNITDNIQGIASIEYIYTTDIDSIQDVINGSINQSQIVLKSGMEWKQIPITRKSSQFSTKQKENDGGILYESVLKFRLAKDSTDFTTELNSMALRYIIVRETDMNGTVRLIGSIKNPAKLSFDITKTGFNGYECEINHSGIEPPPYIVS